MKRLAVSALALVWLLLLQLPLTATQEETKTKNAKDDGTPVFMAQEIVNVVNVDVYVTDESGKAVAGLKAEDFEVYENKRLMAVTNFYAVNDAAPAPASPAVVAGDPAPVPQTPPGVSEPEPVPEDQRLHLVIYIDNYNLRPFNRLRVNQDLRKFLRETLKKDDRVMLVSYDRSLKVRRPFTTDVQSIIDALFELDEVSAQGVHYDSERRDALERIKQSQNANEAMAWARQYADSFKNDLTFTVDAMKQIVGSLAGLAGRKAVVYVSDGIPMVPGEDLFYLVDQKFPNTGSLTQMFSYNHSRRFEELTSSANANRVSFYTIDAAGLRVYSAASVEADEAGQAGQSGFIDSIATRNVQAPLQMLAEQTGGQAVLNRNRFLEPLQRIAADFRTFYSLGYSPSHAGDGRYYTIEVKLKNPNRKWNVRHRAGYRDKSADSQMNDGVSAALQYPFYSNPLDLEISFGTAQPKDRNFLVPVEVRVPLGALVLVRRGEVYEAAAKLYIAAIDGDNNSSDVQSVPLPIRIPPAEVEAARGKMYLYTVSLLMRPGSQKVAIGVRDEIAGTNSFVSRAVNVGR